VHVGLLDDRRQGLLGQSARLQKAWEVAAFPELGDAQLDRPGARLPRPVAVAWRSRLDANRNVIVVNNGHRDFVYASRSKSLKLRYLVRLYAKELVMHNFVGLPADQLLERMVELSLRTEEHL
jgi:hypothetical protein